MNKKSIRARMQAFGGFLTAMVIPNMGAFIAWGFITALFIDTGWLPNKSFSQIVTPMSTYLLPLLIAFMGGKIVGGDRGGVAGTVGTIGLIVGADIPMFLGAMIMGPLSALVIKKFDQFVENKVPAGFEMIISNFSLGIIGMVLCLCSYSFIGPVILQANHVLSAMIQSIVKTGALPLLALLNEPAKILFLNNVIDQGVYYPLGMQQALETGKSIFFMVASNPGPGLGLLLAYSVFGKGDAKKTAPGAVIIHFFGGIHEMYFPYVLMKPITILGMIAGAASGIVTFSTLNVGLVAGPSPGSIFSYLALTPKGNFLGVIAGVTVAAAVSFAVNSFLLRVSKDTGDEELAKSRERSKAMKQEGKDILNGTVSGERKDISERAVSEEGSGISGKAVSEEENGISGKAVSGNRIEKVVFACDAGLGSSAMGATAFRKRLEKAGVTMDVKNYAIEKVPKGIDVIVTHQNLLERAQGANPGVRIVTIENFLKDANIEALYEEIINAGKQPG